MTLSQTFVFQVAIAVTRYMLISHFSLYMKCFTKPLIAVTLLAVWLFSFGWMVGSYVSIMEDFSIQVQVPPLLSVWGTLGEDRQTFTCTIKRDSKGRLQPHK